MPKETNTSGKLGFSSCVMILIGTMIGSAIFSLSGLTILMAGPAAMLSWLIAGVIMLFYGMYMAELACRYPQSGGVYVFPRKAFGEKTGKALGWLSCWSAILTNIIAVAFSGIYVGQYLSVAFPWAGKLQIPIAVGAILICHVLNLVRINLTGKINALVVFLLLGTILCYGGTAFFGGRYDTNLLFPYFSQGTNGVTGFIAAIPVAIIGFGGVVALAFMASDVQNAQKTIPRAIAIATTVVIAIYLLTIGATVGLVNANYLQDHPSECFIPLFSACFTKLTATPWLASVVSISAVLALMTTMLVCVSMNARAIQAASMDGILPAMLGKNNGNGVPANAAAITCAFAMVYACFPALTMQIVNFGALFNVLTLVLTMLAVLKSRRDSGITGNVFSVPGGNVLPVILLAILVACNVVSVISGGWQLWTYTMAFLILGYAILRVRHGGKNGTGNA